MAVQTHTPPAGEQTEVVTPVESKQGTDKPKGMPIVVLVSTLGAFIGMGLVFLLFFR